MRDPDRDKAVQHTDRDAAGAGGVAPPARRSGEPPPSPEEARERVETADAGRRTRLTHFVAVVKRHPYAALVVALLVIGAGAGGAAWWLSTRGYVSTDDAYIDARAVSISSPVNGVIVELPVTDNELVAAGGVLARIDARDYQAAVDQAAAQVEQARSSIANIGAQIEAQQARIDQAEQQAKQAQAALTYARQQNERAQNLLQTGAGTRQNAEEAASNLRQAEAAYQAARANLDVNEKQIAVLRTQRQVASAQLGQAQAALMQAQANLARTVITAPTAGWVTQLSAAQGNYAQAGQTLMMFVPHNVWVTANFKETQITHMRPGQPVDIYVDAYPGRVFHGRVDSIQAGSGAAFSLLPPENATGNFVKVVQRVPVKIVFDQQPDVRLGPGMSVQPYVKVS